MVQKHGLELGAHCLSVVRGFLHCGEAWLAPGCLYLDTPGCVQTRTRHPAGRPWPACVGPSVQDWNILPFLPSVGFTHDGHPLPSWPQMPPSISTEHVCAACLAPTAQSQELPHSGVGDSCLILAPSGTGGDRG